MKCSKDMTATFESVATCQLGTEYPYGCLLTEPDYACSCSMGHTCVDASCGRLNLGKCQCCSWWVWFVLAFLVIFAVGVAAFFIFFWMRYWKQPKTPLERVENYSAASHAHYARAAPVPDEPSHQASSRDFVDASYRFPPHSSQPPLTYATDAIPAAPPPLAGSPPRLHADPPSSGLGDGPWGGKWRPDRPSKTLPGPESPPLRV